MYCKLWKDEEHAELDYGINSSKVYCKYRYLIMHRLQMEVLIVAKCIVNNRTVKALTGQKKVLIVAKCIVNLIQDFIFQE